MNRWNKGDRVVIRNIARSDGTVTTAVPSIVLVDEDLLALYIPTGVNYKNNWVVPPTERAAALDAVVPSAQRQYRDLMMQNDSIRLYLPGRGYSIGLSFDTQEKFQKKGTGNGQKCQTEYQRCTTRKRRDHTE